MGLSCTAFRCQGSRRAKSAPPPPSSHFSKICHTYPTNETRHSYTLPKKRFKMYMNHVTYFLSYTVTYFLSYTDNSIFSPEFCNFSISKNTDIDWILEQFLILLI